MRRRKENFDESDRSRIRDKDWYQRYRFHNDVPYSWDEESIPKHIPQTVFGKWGPNDNEKIEIKSIVRITRKDKFGNILEEKEIEYYPYKNDKKGKENDQDKI